MAMSCHSGQSGKEPIQRTYLGITLGKTTMAEAKEALTGFDVGATAVDGVQVLVVKEPSVSGVKFRAVGFWFGNGVPDSIGLISYVQHFGTLLQTFTDRYGKPAKSVVYGCDTYTWRDDSTEFELMHVAKADTLARLMVRNAGT
jgi:hypothetical protein